MVTFLVKLAFTLIGFGAAGFVGLLVAEDGFNCYVKPYWKYAVSLVLVGAGILFLMTLVALWRV